MSSFWLIYGAIIATVLMWSHAFVAIKYCLQSVTPWELVILRHVPAAVLFVIYSLVSKKRNVLRRMVREDGWRFALIGLLAVTGYHYALNIGTERISAGTASLIVGTAPVFTFITAALLIGEKPTWTKAGGIALAFVGLYVCVRYGGGRETEIRYLLGALVAVLSPIFAAFYATLSKPLVEKYDSLTVTALMLIFGTVPLLVTISPNLLMKLPHLPAGFWAADLFLGFCNTALAYVLWLFALGRLEATKVTTFIYIIPLLGILWGWVYLDEPVTLWFVAGAATTILGIVVTNRAGGAVSQPV